MATVTNTPNALKRALLLDAGASGTMGILLLAAAGGLEPVLGLPTSLLRGVGAFLIPFAASLIWISARRHAVGLIKAIVLGNVLWVIASVLLLVSGVVSPTMLGEAFVVAQAAAVALFAYLEHRALRDRAGDVDARASVDVASN